MKNEGEQVHEEVEKAARLLVDAAGGRAVGELAEEIHGRHPVFPVEVLERRVSFRATEIRNLIEIVARRFERDLVDRAKLVASGENTFNDATAAIQLAYPDKDWSEIVLRLNEAIQARGAQEA